MITITAADGIPTKTVINILLVHDNAPDDEGWVGAELVEVTGRVEEMLETKGVDDIALEWGKGVVDAEGDIGPKWDEVADVILDVELEWGEGVVDVEGDIGPKWDEVADVILDVEPEWGEGVVDIERDIGPKWDEVADVIRDVEPEWDIRVGDIKSDIITDWVDEVVDVMRGEPVDEAIFELVDDSKVDSDVLNVFIIDDDIVVEEDNSVLFAISSKFKP